jgi:hypothetical protein
MTQFIEIKLEKSGVSCLAKLLHDEAPRTCAYVWDSLPQGGDARHAKYASNEVYCLVPPLEGKAPGRENSTITPIPGDVVLFSFPSAQLPAQTIRALELEPYSTFVDLAIFYDRNNLLLDPAVGFVPGNVFGTIVENLEAMATACKEAFRNGIAGERLTFNRAE